jgi:hypothetical protein
VPHSAALTPRRRAGDVVPLDEIDPVGRQHRGHLPEEVVDDFGTAEVEHELVS